MISSQKCNLFLNIYLPYSFKPTSILTSQPLLPSISLTNLYPLIFIKKKKVLKICCSGQTKTGNLENPLFISVSHTLFLFLCHQYYRLHVAETRDVIFLYKHKQIRKTQPFTQISIILCICTTP